MQLLNRVIIAPVLFALLFVSSVKAQAPVYKQGDIIRVQVKFDGPDASKISSVNFYAKTDKPTNPNQPNFAQDFGTNQCGGSTRKDDHTWEASCVVRGNQASGEYQIIEISAQLTLSPNGVVGFSYPKGDFPPITFKIENSNTAAKPGIKSVTVQ